MRAIQLRLSEDQAESKLTFTDDVTFCFINDVFYEAICPQASFLSARAGHVLLDVKACGLSPLNTKLLTAVSESKDILPVGFEVSGIVKEVGPEVISVCVGDAVTGILPLSSECSGCADECEISEFAIGMSPKLTI
jgi:NADPH:quinone reductase-like Zn-dependent oxidoreductase